MNRRDIELLISARETTGRSFGQVGKNIDTLNKKIQEQIVQAERGEISLQDLRKTQDELSQAGRDLSAIQGQIDAYRRLEEQNKKNSAAAEQAVADFAKFKTELAALETVTARQETKLSGLERKVRTTSAAFEKSTVDINAQVAALNRAGVEVGQLDTIQQSIIASARTVGQSFVSIGASVDSYSDNVRRARDAERQFAAQNVFDEKLAQARQLGEATRFVQLYEQAIGSARQADNQLAALNGFRSVGALAAEASRDLSQFVTVGQTVDATTSNIAAGLRSIIQPGTEALRTLDGVENAIRQAAAIATAETGSVAQFSNAINDLSAASAALVSQGGLIDAFQRQERATEVARQQFKEAQGDVQRFAAAMQAADVPTDALTQSLGQAEARLKTTGNALTVEETKLGELSRGLRQAGVDTRDLASAQARLEAAATQTAGALQAGNQRLGRGGEKSSGLFGLNPFELQNLSFQINDIFVSLASGQRPLTVLLQQGSQIGQLFPGIFTRLAGALTGFVGAAVVGLGLFIALLVDSADAASRLEDVQKGLANSNFGDAFDAQALADQVETLERLGVAAEDAKDLLLDLANEGFSQAEVIAFSETIQQLSERLGIELADAQELFISATQGGIEALIEYNDKTAEASNGVGDFTIAQLEEIEALYDAGDAAGATTRAIEILRAKNEEVAGASESKWTPAINNLKGAFSNLANILTNGAIGRGIRQIQTDLDNLAIGAAYVFALLAGKGLDGAKADALAAFKGTTAGRKKSERDRGTGGGSTPQERRDAAFERTLATEDEYKIVRKLSKEERLRLAGDKARSAAIKARVSDGLKEEAIARAIAAETSKIAAEEAKAAKTRGRKKTGASKAERETKARERQIGSLEKSLESQLLSLDSAAGRGKSASLEDRLSVVDNKYSKIFTTLQGLRDLGIKDVDGVALADIEAQVNASKELLKNEERIKFFEDQVTLLTTQRKDEIEAITSAQERGAKTVTQAYEEAQAVNARLSPQIVNAARQALEIARGIAGATPSPEMVSMIASLERIVNSEGTTDIVEKVGLKSFADQEEKLSELLKDRDDLIQSYQVLEQLGVNSAASTREATAAAYAASAGSILPVIQNMRETLALLNQQKSSLTGLPLISDQAYATWLAKLQAVEAGLVNVDARQKQVQDAARQGIERGVAQAYQTVADTIVGLVQGTLTWGDALNGVLNAGLSLLGSFLDAIAQVLVQMVAIQVAKSLIGGGFGGFLFHSGGVVGGGNGMTRTNIRGDWTGAPKLHSGGGMGLKADEYKAVLQRGEEVLTADDPRHISNIGKGGGGEGGGGGQSLKQVLVLDPDAVPSAMQTKSGERAILTVVRANIPTIKQMLNA